MRIDADPAPGGFLEHTLEVVDHDLAVVPLVVHNTVVVDALYSAAVRDVARLYLAYAQ